MTHEEIEESAIEVVAVLVRAVTPFGMRSNSEQQQQCVFSGMPNRIATPNSNKTVSFDPSTVATKEVLKFLCNRHVTS